MFFITEEIFIAYKITCKNTHVVLMISIKQNKLHTLGIKLHYSILCNEEICSQHSKICLLTISKQTEKGGKNLSRYKSSRKMLRRKFLSFVYTAGPQAEQIYRAFQEKFKTKEM